MDEPLDELYFTWLYSQVGAVKLRNRAKTYWSLTRQLFQKEFIWFIPNDDNRVADGKDLRYEFLDESGIEEVDPEWMDLGCSMLELMIVLARSLAFLEEGDPRVWFWHLVETIDLAHHSDRYFNDRSEKEIDRALDKVIFRTYTAAGKGGFFPLERPQQDQREVELWYQLNAYLLELPQD